MAKIHVMLSGKKLGEHPMKSMPWIVGRHNTCHVQIDNPSVSRRHCRFTYDNGSYYVEDMGSSNGTHIQGERITRTKVENGTEINVGKYVLIFEDTGMELVPTSRAGGSAGKPAGGKVGFSGVERTFQMDAATLREQMAKAGVAAAGATDDVVKKASDVAKEFDLNAQLATRKPRRLGKYIIAGVTVLGIAMLGALAVLAFYMVTAK